MSRGRLIGLDVGTVRIGVAASDPGRILASPVETVPATDAQAALRRVLSIISEYEAVGIVVGLPMHMSGNEGASAQMARDFASRVAEHTGLPVRFVDERRTSVQAAHQMRLAGRTARNSKREIDQAAAMLILQAALDADERSGHTELGGPHAAGLD